jgi:hypothetical protein
MEEVPFSRVSVRLFLVVREKWASVGVMIKMKFEILGS